MNLILHQGDFRLFWDPEHIFVIICNVAFNTVKTNNNTIVIFKSINKLLTVFAIGNKVKEPLLASPSKRVLTLALSYHLSSSSLKSETNRSLR
jgi:flagellar motor component MotA